MSAKKPKSEQLKRNWSPVRQQAADSFLIMTIVSFAVTVIFVRVFLQLTGYPQVGDSTFHIAHLLWGGLLLFAAVVMVLMWANHWALWAASLAAGIGMGLFIDEVGKFITQDNDYFFPLAFPIIYAFLLICVWLYLRVRKSRAEDARSLLYHALEDMKQVLDHDLDPFERRQLVNSLNAAMGKTRNPNEERLAKALLDYVRAEDVRLAKQPNAIERTWDWTRFIAARWPSRRVFKWLLIAGFVWSGFSSLVEISALWAILGGAFQNTELPAYVIQSGKEQYQFNSPTLLGIHAAGILATGGMCAAAALMMMFRRERRGLRVGSLAMVLSLTVVSLLTFYLSQVYAVTDALSQLILLVGAGVYRWRFYLNR
jgi:hypothetical protein